MAVTANITNSRSHVGQISRCLPSTKHRRVLATKKTKPAHYEVLKTGKTNVVACGLRLDGTHFGPKIVQSRTEPNFFRFIRAINEVKSAELTPLDKLKHISNDVRESNPTLR